MTLQETNSCVARLGLELRYCVELDVYYLYQERIISSLYQLSYPAYKTPERAVAMAQTGVRPYLSWRNYSRL